VNLPLTLSAPPVGGRPKLYAEPFAGTFSVGLRLLFGDRGRPLTGYLGSKRRLAAVILRVLGLRAGQGAESVYLQDAGCWGRAWSVLLEPAGARAVAAQLRGWAGEDPRALWARLAKEPPPASWSAETAAAFLALQAGNARGRPVWRLEGLGPWVTAGYAHLSKSAREGGSRERFRPALLAERVERIAPRDVAAWLVLQGSQAGNVAIWPGACWRFDDHRSRSGGSCRIGRTMHDGIKPTTQAERLESIAPSWKTARCGTHTPQPAYHRGGGAGRGVQSAGVHAARVEAIVPRDVARWLWLQGREHGAVPVFVEGGRWRCGKGARAGSEPIGQRGERSGSGLRDPATLARRTEVLGADWPAALVVPSSIQAVSPLDVCHQLWAAWPDLRDTVWLLDPPYSGLDGAEVFTGYGHHADRADVLHLARQLDAAGATVAICEAAAVHELGDWYHVDLSHLAGRQRLKAAREWLTLNRPPACDVGRALPRTEAHVGEQLALLGG